MNAVQAAILGILSQAQPAGWQPDTGLIAWFDFLDASKWNNSTKEWTARLGSGILVPSDEGPTLSTTAFDGSKSALVFDGSSDTGMVFDHPNADEMVVVIAMNITDIGDDFPVVWNRGFLGINTSGLQVLSNWGTQVSYAAGAKAEDYSFVHGEGPQLFVTRHAIAARTLRINGSHMAENTAAAAGSEPDVDETFELCRWVDAPTDWTVEIAAVGLFHASAWSTGYAQQLEGYACHNNLGVTTAVLPSGHPYKSVAPE